MAMHIIALESTDCTENTEVKEQSLYTEQVDTREFYDFGGALDEMGLFGVRNCNVWQPAPPLSQAARTPIYLPPPSIFDCKSHLLYCHL